LKFDLKAFTADADLVLSAVSRIAPMAAAIGIPVASPAAALAGKLAEVAQAALDGAADVNAALTAQDQQTLTDLIGRLNTAADLAEAEAAAAEKAALA
jgi:hypothetical protein